MSIAITLHLLAVVVWVGGMFFAWMALRPVAAPLLEPPLNGSPAQAPKLTAASTSKTNRAMSLGFMGISIGRRTSAAGHHGFFLLSRGG